MTVLCAIRARERPNPGAVLARRDRFVARYGSGFWDLVPSYVTYRRSTLATPAPPMTSQCHGKEL